MRIKFLIAVALTIAAPALAATPTPTAKAAKPKCPKGQVPLTSTVTGDHYCAAMGGVSVVGGGAQPVLIPEKPAKKTKP
jgi:hypothetical protein